MDKRRPLRLVVLGTALTLGLISGASTLTSGCVVNDECIVLISSGKDWCVTMVGALMWPVGQPELAVPVIDGLKPPVGCDCFNAAEEEILWLRAPQAKYEEFADEVTQNARDRCDSIVPIGWDHNCYDEGPEGPLFDSLYPGELGDCVGDCIYSNVPKDGCGDDPTPYDCEELYGDGETGDAETQTDTDTGAELPDPRVNPSVQGGATWKL